MKYLIFYSINIYLLEQRLYIKISCIMERDRTNKTECSDSLFSFTHSLPHNRIRFCSMLFYILMNNFHSVALNECPCFHLIHAFIRYPFSSILSSFSIWCICLLAIQKFGKHNLLVIWCLFLLWLLFIWERWIHFCKKIIT